MSLTDFTYMVSLGHACAPAFQLKRLAERLAIAPDRVRGPFDKMVVSVDQLRRVLADDFRFYMLPSCMSAIKPPVGRHWRAADAAGIRAMHHLERFALEEAPTAQSWFKFGTWLGKRLTLWRQNLERTDGRVLFVRMDDSSEPDDDERIALLLADLRRCVRGRFSLAWVSYGESSPPSRLPNTIRGAVRPTWRCAPGEAIDWNRDYGLGTAWKGCNPDWDALWSTIDEQTT